MAQQTIFTTPGEYDLSGPVFLSQTIGSGESDLSGSLFLLPQGSAGETDLSGSAFLYPLGDAGQLDLTGSLFLSSPPSVTITKVTKLSDRVKISFTTLHIDPTVVYDLPNCSFSLDNGTTWLLMVPFTSDPAYTPGPFAPDNTTQYTFVWNTASLPCPDLLDNIKIRVAIKTLSGGVDLTQGQKLLKDGIEILFATVLNGKIQVVGSLTDLNGDIFTYSKLEYLDGNTWVKGTSTGNVVSGVVTAFWDYKVDVGQAVNISLRLTCVNGSVNKVSEIRSHVSSIHGNEWLFGPGQEFEDHIIAYRTLTDYYAGRTLTATQIVAGVEGEYRGHLDLYNMHFPLNTNNGLNLIFTSIDKTRRVKFSGDAVIANSSFDRADNTLLAWKTNVLQCNTRANLYFFEDGKPLTSVVDVATCEATPGSYYFTPARVLYVHPFDSSRARTNGKVYEYTTDSHLFSWMGTDINVRCKNLRFDHLDFKHSAASDGAGDGWCIYLANNLNDTEHFSGLRITNCRFESAQGAVYVNGAKDALTIKGNSYVSSNPEYKYGYQLHFTGDNFVFQNNYSDFGSSDGAHIFFESLKLQAGSDSIVKQNVFIGSGQHISCQTTGLPNTSHLHITENIFRANPTLTQYNAETVSITDFSDAYVAGNAFLDCGIGSSIIKSNVDTIEIRNNTVWWDPAFTDVFDIMDFSNGTPALIIEGNLFGLRNGTKVIKNLTTANISTYKIDHNVYLERGTAVYIDGYASTFADMTSHFEFGGRHSVYKNVYAAVYKASTYIDSIDLTPLDAIAKRVYNPNSTPEPTPTPVPVCSDMPVANGTVLGLLRSGTTMYVMGQFTTFGGLARNKIAAFDTVTGNVLPFTIDFAEGSTNSNNGVSSTSRAVLVGGVLYVGGQWTIYDNSNNLVSAGFIGVDPTTGARVKPRDAVIAQGYVDVLLAVGNVIYICCEGNLTIGAVNNQYCAAYDTVTGLATAWLPAINNSGVYAMVHVAPYFYIGGGFQAIGGNTSFPGFCRINDTTGVLDTTWQPSIDPTNAYIYGMDTDGTYIYVGGYQGTMGGFPSPGFNKVAIADASTDPNWGTANSFGQPGTYDSYINSIKYFNGNVYLNGYFQIDPGFTQWQDSVRIAVDGTIDTHQFPGQNDNIYDWSFTTGETVFYVGGDIEAAPSGNHLKTNLQKLQISDLTSFPACHILPNINQSGSAPYSNGSPVNVGFVLAVSPGPSNVVTVTFSDIDQSSYYGYPFIVHINGQTVFTFDDTNWNIPQTVIVTFTYAGPGQANYFVPTHVSNAAGAYDTVAIRINS